MRPKRYYRHMDADKAEAIRRAHFSREANQRQLAERYGVRQHTVSRIVSGFSWSRP